MQDYQVQYELLRPAEMVARRKEFPVAWLPIGTLEWHGPQNPLGLDVIKAHGILLRCARKVGGVVFPPLFYGEVREQAMVDVGKAAEFEVPPENFEPGYMFYSVAEQTTNYHRLLIHVLHEIASLGFRVIIVCAGHYPLLDHGRAAMSVFRQTARRRRQPTTGWVFTGYELVRDIFPKAGDHGGPWETSLMMALDPETVDLKQLPEAAVQDNPDGFASAEFGERALDAIVEIVTARAKDMIANPDKYLGHYTAL